MLHRRLWRHSVTAVALVLALTACSGGSDESDNAGGDNTGSQETSQATSEATAEPVDPERVSPENLTKVPAIKDGEGAIADAKMGRCVAKPGQRRVRGTVTNSSGAASDMLVVVSWVNDQSDVLARGVAVVRDLAPDASRNFVARAKVPAGATDCTFLVQRGAVA